MAVSMYWQVPSSASRERSMPLAASRSKSSRHRWLLQGGPGWQVREPEPSGERAGVGRGHLDPQQVLEGLCE